MVVSRLVPWDIRAAITQVPRLPSVLTGIDVATLALSTLLSACVDRSDELGDLESRIATVPGATYSIVHANGRCLDVPGFSRSSGQLLQGFACKTDPA